MTGDSPAPESLAQILSDSARIVSRVVEGKSVSAEFSRVPVQGMARAARLDLTHGTLRRFGLSQAILAALTHRGAPEPLVQALVWCALYALESGRYKPYAVVDQAVRASAQLDHPHARGFVNGVLRRYLRDREAIVAAAERAPEARYRLPQWWLDELRQDHPSAWEDIAAAGNQHPPMCLRINRRRTSIEVYEARLQVAGIESRRVGPEALLLGTPVPIDRLPGFQDGLVSVQDAGAQRAARCLEPLSGQRVLDACAAPGGKSAHLLELADIKLTALDIDADRCARMGGNFHRLGVSATIHAADCLEPGPWREGLPYDRILADVPCSASGIARRRPDTRWLRRPADLNAFAIRQGKILDALWPLLAPNGKLLYATCSVFARENALVIRDFLARAPTAARIPLPDGGDAQMLPDDTHDGFFYALIAKPA